MSVYLGDFPTSATVRFKWDTNAVAGESITRATNGSLRIYKGDSTTERSSSNGITDTEDFDALTGVHHCAIDLSDDTDAGFYAAGSEYQVVLAGATIDGKAINATLAHFSIERSGGELALLKAVIAGASTVAADAVKVGGTTQTARDLGASVLLSPGTGTGQVDLSSGQVKVQSGTGSGQLSVTSGVVAANVKQFNSVAIVSGAVVSDAGNTALTFKTDLSQSATDHWKDPFLKFTAGSLAGQTHRVTGYNGTTKFITVTTAFTAAPSPGDTFDLVNN